MDNLDDSENNAKVSDSGYSNSCSNSQTRSHSSKSTHSGSHSSVSSGYGGKPSSSSNATTEVPEKIVRAKDKETKKKFLSQTEIVHYEEDEDVGAHGQEIKDEDKLENEDDILINIPSIPSDSHAEVESMDISSCGSVNNYEQLPIFNDLPASPSFESFQLIRTSSTNTEGFACVISMHDGVVMYTTSSLTSSLGYPKDMWIGRSFIDFLHKKDRSTFASQITNSLAVPKTVPDAWSKPEDDVPQNYKSKMFCRIRKYRSLTSFGVKCQKVVHLPFLLMLSFKNITEDNCKTIYLVIQAVPFYSAFKVPHEVLPKPVSFILRHSASGKMEYIDPESVPYLGYLPQDLAEKDALQLFHPDDMEYVQKMYEELVKKGNVTESKPYRMLCHNGEYVKLITEWSAVINPWSRKLEYVIGKHVVVEGPQNPDVFYLIDQEVVVERNDADKTKVDTRRENIIRILSEVLTKPAEIARQKIRKRCQLLMSFMESISDELTAKPKLEDELRLDIQDADNERDSVLLGVISPHHSDSKSSTDTRMSYTQLNYKETLQRYFDSYLSSVQESVNDDSGSNVAVKKETSTSSKTPVAKSTNTKNNQSSENADASKHEKKLTQELLKKHNVGMEKGLAKKIRENRSVAKSERQKVFNEQKQKKKEHIARCNASYYPTMIGKTGLESQLKGLKRLTDEYHEDEEQAIKHNGLGHRRKRQKGCSTNAAQSAEMPPPPNVTFPKALTTGFPSGIVPVVSPVVSGVVPMIYVPTATTIPAPTNGSDPQAMEGEQNSVQYLMYLQAVFGSSFMLSPIATPTQMSMPQNIAMEQAYMMQPKPLELTNSNYLEACKQHVPPVTKKKKGNWKHAKLLEARRKEASRASSSKVKGGSNGSSSEVSSKPPPTLTISSDESNRTSLKIPDSRTDGESSYPSLYSTCFKTESGSAEDSDTKNNIKNWDNGANQKPNEKVGVPEQTEEDNNYLARGPIKITEPPWMEKINLTPDLIYKYQITTKSMDDVLQEDKDKIEKMEQPSLVNEQMRQLMLDLQLEGEAAKLTLEEGITSSSSGEETNDSTKIPRRKREYQKIAMFYEENAPFPPSPEGNAEGLDQAMESA